MDIISTADLRKKEIINLCDGARLGCATDFEFDRCSSVITGLILKKENGFFGLCESERVIIPWCRVECIGDDTILVRFQSDELASLCKKRRKSFFNLY